MTTTGTTPTRLDLSTRERAWRTLVIAAGVAAAVGGLAWVANAMSANAIWPAATDMGLYLRSADAIANGQSPYLDSESGFRYVYPPLFADFLAILVAVFGQAGAAWVWMGASVAAMCAAVVLMTRNFGLRVPMHWIVLMCGMVLLARAGRSEIYHGQVNFALVLLLVSGLLNWREGRTYLAAVLWALAICVKPFLGVIVLFLLRRGDWRAAASTFGISGVIFFLSFLPAYHNIVGAFFDWRETTQHFATPGWAANLLNQSFYAVLLRLFTENAFTQAWIDAPLLVPIGLAFFGAIAAVAFVVVSARTKGNEENGAIDLLCFSAALAALMSLGPITEGNHLYYVSPGLVAACAIALRRWKAGAANRLWWLAAAVAWGCVMLAPLSPKLIDRTSSIFLQGPGVLLTGWSAYALLAAAALSAAALWRERKA